MDWLDNLRAEGERATRLANDLEYYAAQLLRIQTQVRGDRAVQFNPAQRELHKRLEEQKRATGKVRAIVVKGRQLGASTYLAGRFFRAVTTNPGTRSKS